MFSAKAQTVFENYEARRAQDEARQQELGPAGFAVRDEFLLPVGPEVGQFLHSLIIAKRPKVILEFGTSYGYSTLFLASAAKAVGTKVITMEIADYKQDYAKEQIEKAGLSDAVDFRLGDAVHTASSIDSPIDFALIDIWKELYQPSFDVIYPKMADEAILCSDNMINPPMWREDVRRYRAAVKSKSDLQTALLPIGSGIEISVKWPAGSEKL